MANPARDPSKISDSYQPRNFYLALRSKSSDTLFMDRDKITSVTVARDFFSIKLRSVLDKRQISIQGDAFEYLVTLMVRFMETDTFFARSAEGKLEDNYLLKLYSEYVTGTPEVRRQALKRLGDVCLMVTGFFSDSLNRKLVDVGYYFGMGGAAYWHLAQQVVPGPNAMFQELSVKFKTVSNVLNEMSDRSGLQNNKDLLRIYERWLQTKSDHLKEILSEKGIQSPLLLDIKTKH